jgi:co-chaperonin GroES (HSP10)
MDTILDPKLIKPVGKHILVETFEGDNTTDSGLELADTASNSFPVSGTIIASGPQSEYSIGQEVMFRRYSLDELKISSGGKEQTVYLLEDTDILAIYGGEETPPKNPYEQIEKRRDITNNKNEDATEETPL